MGPIGLISRITLRFRGRYNAFSSSRAAFRKETDMIELPLASPSAPAPGAPPAEKVRTFPASSGVYLMKDAGGNVIYVGKAKNLRSRAGSYFGKDAASDARIRDWIGLVADIDFISTDDPVAALLLEARMVKDLRPRFNKDLKDDKTFPYLQIRTREEFPRVEITRQPRRKGVKLYGPFTSVGSLRAAVNVLQKVFQYRTCALDIRTDDKRWKWFRPCLLHSIRQCTAPCNFRVSRDDYRRQIKKLILVLDGKKGRLVRRMERQMQEASVDLNFEKAARAARRDRIAQKARPPRQRDEGRPARGVPDRPQEGPARAAEGARPGQDAADHRGHGHRPPERPGHRGVAGDVPRRPAVQGRLPAVQDQERGPGWTTSPRCGRW